MKLLDQYNDILEQIYDYFCFKEGWHVYPIHDQRKIFWCINDDSIYGWGSMEAYKNLEESDYYTSEIITHAPKGGVYEATDFTAVLVNTNMDGNKLLNIYDNSKKVEWKDEIRDI